VLAKEGYRSFKIEGVVVRFTCGINILQEIKVRLDLIMGNEYLIDRRNK